MPDRASDRASDALQALSFRDARRRYGRRPALDGVSLEVGAGEIYALVGPNGAGKSTLARAALGALRLDGGEVRVFGADPGRERAARREIGVAPQEIALYPKLTVVENLQAFAALARVPRAAREGAIAEALAQSACTACARERVERLSGGWRRRANLAAALVHRPRLLVLDEPSEGLDADTRAALSDALHRLRDRGAAVLLISHDASDVLALADRIGVLDRGRLVAEGAPATLIAEAFGGCETVTLRLAQAASPETAAVLTRHGLTTGADPMVWSAVMADAAARARGVHDALDLAGVAFREVAVRPPGLDQFIALTVETAQIARDAQGSQASATDRP